MAELVLGLGREHTKSLCEASGNEKRVISESARTHLLREQTALHAAVRDMQYFAITSENHAAVKASGEADVLR